MIMLYLVICLKTPETFFASGRKLISLLSDTPNLTEWTDAMDCETGRLKFVKPVSVQFVFCFCFVFVPDSGSIIK